jgi:hypothetical protein
MAKETYKVGSFHLPMTRLSPNAINDIKVLYESTIGKAEIPSIEIARILGFSSPSSGGFYRRLNSLILYGLIEPASRGIFKISQLGKDIQIPSDEYHRKQAFRKAVFNVPLWKSLYDRVKKNPDNLYSHLISITAAEPLHVRNAEDDIKRWYIEDISLVSNEVLVEEGSKFGSDNNSRRPMSREIDTYIENDSFGTIAVNGIGSVSVKDGDSLEAAEAFFKILRKKVEAEIKRLEIPVSQTADVESSPETLQPA